jgi:TPP-dependent pyruvate/acetoin dehydrogenase alpha subunit
MSETVTKTPDMPVGASELELFRRMLLARRFDERCAEMRLAGRFDGVMHPAIGQEAVAVGACAYLCPTDRITSTHRGHHHTIAKGADVRRMMAELFGKRDGYCRGIGGSMHIADFGIGMLGANGIVGAGLPIAAGAAMANVFSDDGGIVVCFFSDGAVGEGTFHETINLAALMKLPIVLMCENNGWAKHVPVEASLASGTVCRLAEAYGVANETVDGNNLPSVLEASRRAIDHARGGEGPYLVEAMTFRISVHALRAAARDDYRDRALIERWKQRDPVERYRRSLQESEVATENELERVSEDVERLLDDAVAFADASAYLAIADLEEMVFSR